MNNDLPNPSADEEVESKIILAEYIESGTFVAGEEDVFTAGIEGMEQCVIMSKAAFEKLRQQHNAEREDMDSQIVVLKAECFALKENLDDRRARVDRLESELATAQKTIEDKQKLLEAACRDWADDDTRLRAMVNELLPDADTEGDLYGVPGILDFGDMLSNEIRSLRSQLQTAMEEGDALAVSSSKGIRRTGKASLLHQQPSGRGGGGTARNARRLGGPVWT